MRETEFESSSDKLIIPYPTLASRNANFNFLNWNVLIRLIINIEDEIWTSVNLTRKGHFQYSTVAITTFCLVCFGAVTCELDDVSNNRLNERTSQELNFRLITTAKNNLTEIHIISANALRFPLCPIMALDMYKDILNTKNILNWIGWEKWSF